MLWKLGLDGAKPWMIGQATGTLAQPIMDSPNEEVPIGGSEDIIQQMATASEPQAAGDGPWDRAADAGSLHVSALVCVAPQAEAFQAWKF